MRLLIKHSHTNANTPLSTSDENTGNMRLFIPMKEHKLSFSLCTHSLVYSLSIKSSIVKMGSVSTSASYIRLLCFHADEDCVHATTNTRIFRRISVYVWQQEQKYQADTNHQFLLYRFHVCSKTKENISCLFASAHKFS